MHKKVEKMEIVCRFYPIGCYIIFFTIVDSLKNILYISLHCVWTPSERASIDTCLECLCINHITLRVNIGSAFQRLRELKERESLVALFLLDK